MKNFKSPSRPSRRTRGMTMVEIMVALTIVLTVMAAILTFFLSTLRATTLTTTRVENNTAMKAALDELYTEARAAQRFEIYTNYADLTPTIAGESGDYLVLYYNKLVSLQTTPCRMVGYYLDTSTPSNPKLIKHELTTADVGTDLSLLRTRTTASPPANRKLVAQRITNTDTATKLFYNVDGQLAFRFRACFFPSQYDWKTGQKLQQSNIDVAISMRQ